jgi:hypothetical protein
MERMESMGHVWKRCSCVGRIHMKYGPRMNDLSIRGAYERKTWPAYERPFHTRAILPVNMARVWTTFPYLGLFHM